MNTHNFKCPYCGEENQVKSEQLPESTYIDIEFECQYCENEMKIGWIHKIEVRSITVEAGDLIDE